jgi:hypothetical protein
VLSSQQTLELDIAVGGSSRAGVNDPANLALVLNSNSVKPVTLPPIAGKIGRLDGQSSNVAAGMRQTYDEAAVHWVDCHRKDDGDPRCRLFYDGNSASDCQCPILMATR